MMADVFVHTHMRTLQIEPFIELENKIFHLYDIYKKKVLFYML